MAHMQQIHLYNIEPHDNFKGNGFDRFWYQFSVTGKLEEYSNLLLRQNFQAAIDATINGRNISQPSPPTDNKP